MTGKTTISIDGALAGTRLDMLLLGRHPEFSRTAIQRFIAAGAATVNGEPGKPGLRLEPDDIVEYALPEPDTEASTPQPEEMKLEILHEDGDVLVLNKPAGIAVHPGAGSETGTLVAGLLFREPEAFALVGEDPCRPGIVHRIDKDTSGLLMVAKNDAAHLGLSEQIKAHSFTREYETVVCGAVKQGGTIDAPIGRHKTDRKKMCVTTENSRNAVTHFEVLRLYAGYTHLRVRLETGRTHQIRVHMAYTGHPVAGDAVYGSGKPAWLCGQCLHAKKIGFVHPRTGQYMEFDSALPEYFTKFLKSIEG